MTTVKTAISIDKNLFHQAEDLAQEMQVSRSRLISLALERFITEYESIKIREKLNEAYADGPTNEEEQFLETMRRYQVKLWKDEPW